MTAVTEAFGLGRPLAPPTPHSHRSAPTWTLTTSDGRFLVKRVEVEGREADVARAAAFEQQVARAGIAVPRPVPPVTAAVGLATRVPGFGWLRLYEWIDGRDVRPEDDVAEWLGSTLAAIHALEAAPAPERYVYGQRPIEQWHAWLAAGERLHRRWAVRLRAGLDELVAVSAWVDAALERAGDYVMTHRDVEPWNVLLTPSGPVLIDWDPAGPDSASLEACHAAYAFGPIERTLSAYVAAGGRLRADDDLLARRVGLRLSRLGERLAISTGQLPPGVVPLSDIDHRAGEQIAELPAFARRLRVLGAQIAAQLV
jgi:hypothetical protein